LPMPLAGENENGSAAYRPWPTAVTFFVYSTLVVSLEDATTTRQIQCGRDGGCSFSNSESLTACSKIQVILSLFSRL
jgi:hypothetical protein